MNRWFSPHALAQRARLLAALACFVGAVLLLGWTFAPRPAPQAMAADHPADTAPAESDMPLEEATAPGAAPARLVVYITGAVRAPDVYELPADARVKDLVVAAGGLAPDADAEQVNLAARLKDGQQLHIPRLGEGRAAATGAGAGPALVDLNTASADALEALDGVGQTTARKIVEYRDANGPFTSVEELKNVKGIGPSLFDKIAAQVTVGP
jgi:competence protein ComEA